MKNMFTSLAILCFTVLTFGCTRDVKETTADESTNTSAPVTGTGGMNPSVPSSDPTITGPASGNSRPGGGVADVPPSPTGPGSTTGSTTSSDMRTDTDRGLGSTPPLNPSENPESDVKQPAE